MFGLNLAKIVKKRKILHLTAIKKEVFVIMLYPSFFYLRNRTKTNATTSRPSSMIRGYTLTWLSPEVWSDKLISSFDWTKIFEQPKFN
jgi:hypothetical protein